MGKLNVVVLRYLSRDDFRVLTAVSCSIVILFFALACKLAELIVRKYIKTQMSLILSRFTQYKTEVRLALTFGINSQLATA